MSVIFQNSTPMRHKSSYFINVPNFADKFFTATISFLNSKLKSRVKVSYHIIINVNSTSFNNMLICAFQFFNGQKDVQKFIDPKYLPKEYGGEIPMANMIGLWSTFVEINQTVIYFFFSIIYKLISYHVC